MAVGRILNNNKMQGLLIFVTLLLAAQAKLYQVVAVISPGARYHLSDLYHGAQTKDKWGEITAVGLRQEQNLGKLFRKEYIEKTSLLNSIFNKDQLEIHSLTLNRSISSSLAVLYGMYPLGQGQKLEKAEAKYHIPPYAYHNDSSQTVFALPEGQLVHSVKYDSALLEVCTNEQAEVQRNIKQKVTDYNEMVLTYTPFLKKAASAFGMDTASMNFSRLAALFDSVTVDRYLGVGLPSGFSEDDYTNMKHLYNWYSLFTRSFNLSKAYSTRELGRVVELFDGRVKQPDGSALRWSTISVDEPHIVSLMNELNISSASCTEELYRKGSTQALNCRPASLFASSILFELHSDNAKDFTVKMRHNGHYVNLCQAKNVECSYGSWKERVQKSILPNVQAVCGKPQTHFNPPSILIE